MTRHPVSQLAGAKSGTFRRLGSQPLRPTGLTGRLALDSADTDDGNNAAKMPAGAHQRQRTPSDDACGLTDWSLRGRTPGPVTTTPRDWQERRTAACGCSFDCRVSRPKVRATPVKGASRRAGFDACVDVPILIDPPEILFATTVASRMGLDPTPCNRNALRLLGPRTKRVLPASVCEGFSAVWYRGLSARELVEDSPWVRERHAACPPAWRGPGGDSSVGGGPVRSLRASPSRCGLRRRGWPARMGFPVPPTRCGSTRAHSSPRR